LFHFTFFFEKENILILAHYTGPFTNRTPKKRKITKKSKTHVHLPRSLQRSVRHRRRSRFPIVVGHQSQTPQDGGRRGGLTSRRISRVHCLPDASANSRTHDLYCSFCNYTVKNKNLLGEVIAHLTWILIQIVFFFCADSMCLAWNWIECSQYLKEML